MKMNEKKVYTMDDNVKYISFGVKDMVKELKELNTHLAGLLQVLQNNSSGSNNPF